MAAAGVMGGVGVWPLRSGEVGRTSFLAVLEGLGLLLLRGGTGLPEGPGRGEWWREELRRGWKPWPEALKREAFNYVHKENTSIAIRRILNWCFSI